MEREQIRDVEKKFDQKVGESGELWREVAIFGS
jgi:hypothetical protein